MNKLATAILEAIRDGHRVEFRHGGETVVVSVTSTNKRDVDQETRREECNRAAMMRHETADETLAAAIWNAAEWLTPR